VDKGTGDDIIVADRGCVQVKTDGDKWTKREGVEVKNGRDYAVEEVDSEKSLLLRVVGIIQHQDPDIVMSWDTLDAGLGYMLDRGDRLIPHIDMAKLIGRMPKISAGANRLGDEWMDKTGPGGRTAAIVGRVGICAWRVMSSEVKHPNVSFLPACVGMILGEKLPWHDRGTLVKWWGEGGGRERFRVTGWCMRNAESVVRLLDKLDVVGRTSEGSRLCCTDFSQMLPGIRGSQYKVEGVLQRALLTIGNGHALSPSSQQQQLLPASNPSNLPNVGYLFASPSKADIRNMEALESIPLVLEPESGFYHDPVVVCDFTALYPSIVIAYNLCYSTCAGKIDYRSILRGAEARTTGRVGIMEVPHESVRKVLRNHIFSNPDGAVITPSGSIFVQPSVRQGVLPRILSELLSTRAMIKRCQKAYKNSKSVPGGVIRTLEAKQLALKFISNVTYGYTSATFSGRCCCPLVADAIVEIARRTLAGAKVKAEELGRGERWTGAKVVYGDTDSLFICLPGRTVGEAFDFGEEFCKSVTESNPPPVHLKLEKVYSSCMLQTKKKYCGMKFESRGQREGVWEAKGIETIRKDQCRLTQKLLRGALMTLFKYHNVEKLKQYLERQWTKLLAGKLPVSDFILSGRVRAQYREGGETVTAALVQRLSEKDPLIRNVRNKARIEYVIVAMPGTTGYRIKHGVRTPLELIEGGDNLVVHTAYYATRQLNSALDRAFRLPPYNLNIASWFDNCPKPRKAASFWPAKTGSSTIFHFFGSDTCCMCGAKTMAQGSNKAVVCDRCNGDTAIGGVSLGFARLRRATKEGSRLAKVCSDCNGCINERGFAYDRGGGKGVKLPLANCLNTDCETFHKRHKYREMELEAEAICNAFNVLQLQF
jgi:DNA polymerase zeta